MVIPSILTHASLHFDAKARNHAAFSNAGASRSRGVDEVHVKVSARAETLSRQSSSVDHAKVEELRRRVAAGSFKVDHLELAHAMLGQG